MTLLPNLQNFQREFILNSPSLDGIAKSEPVREQDSASSCIANFHEQTPRKFSSDFCCFTAVLSHDVCTLCTTVNETDKFSYAENVFSSSGQHDHDLLISSLIIHFR